MLVEGCGWSPPAQDFSWSRVDGVGDGLELSDARCGGDGREPVDRLPNIGTDVLSTVRIGSRDRHGLHDRAHHRTPDRGNRPPKTSSAPADAGNDKPSARPGANLGHLVDGQLRRPLRSLRPPEAPDLPRRFLRSSRVPPGHQEEGPSRHPSRVSGRVLARTGRRHADPERDQEQPQGRSRPVPTLAVATRPARVQSRGRSTDANGDGLLAIELWELIKLRIQRTPSHLTQTGIS